MTLYRKDGSVYQVSRPNPLMITQEIWDGDYILYNIENFGRIVETEKTVVEEIKEILPPQPPEENPPLKRNKFRDYKQEILFCLPAQNKIIKDELYGESIAIPGYGEPLKLKGANIGTGNGKALFWLADNIPNGSILFQVEYRSWWRATEILSDGDGYIVRCVVSNETPHFEGA